MTLNNDYTILANRLRTDDSQWCCIVTNNKPHMLGQKTEQQLGLRPGGTCTGRTSTICEWGCQAPRFVDKHANQIARRKGTLVDDGGSYGVTGQIIW